MTLTETKIRTAKPRERAYKMADGDGLTLLIQPTGAKLWRFRYRYAGAEKMLSFGRYPDVSLKRAREKRHETRELLDQGIDPSQKRQSQRADLGNTFEAVAREWMDLQGKTLAADTLDLTRRRLERWAFPHIGSTPVDRLEPPQVLRCLRRVESAGKHETAHRIRQRIGQVCRYAVATGRATRDPTADLKGALSPTPTKHRAAVTDPAGVANLIRVIDGYEGQPSTRAGLQLLALTFVRPGELRRAEWSEFDLQAATWRIPAHRMKMKREHLVPLSRQAVAVLERLQPITGHLPFTFAALRPNRPLSENTLNLALRTLGYSGDTMTAHGFRAMASTLLHELGWPPEVIELQLAHAQRSQVAAAYNRSARLAERREMMQSWADYLDGLKADKVVAIRGAKA